ncbi:MAG: DUF4145 domain-containing protein [Alphaproteobacteria bacterium]|nr:MAG: DUF4145 domain-containing protein [Alphaproteobacteria bacterium]
MNTANGIGMGQQLIGLKRCPHCSIAGPHFTSVCISQGPTPRTDGGKKINWGAYHCSSCGSIVTVSAELAGASFAFKGAFPDAKIAHEDIREPARTFLQQAYETLHAPDAAAVMAGSAVDAMLKAHGLEAGSLYARIDEALTKNLLTQGMADWAHNVRLGSNRPRRADKDKPHVSPNEAKQSVEFAEALGNFLFVLTARVNRGLKAAAGVVVINH